MACGRGSGSEQEASAAQQAPRNEERGLRRVGSACGPSSGPCTAVANAAGCRTRVEPHAGTQAGGTRATAGHISHLAQQAADAAVEQVAPHVRVHRRQRVVKQVHICARHGLGKWECTQLGWKQRAGCKGSCAGCQAQGGGRRDTPRGAASPQHRGATWCAAPAPLPPRPTCICVAGTGQRDAVTLPAAQVDAFLPNLSLVACAARAGTAALALERRPVATSQVCP